MSCTVLVWVEGGYVRKRGRWNQWHKEMSHLMVKEHYSHEQPVTLAASSLIQIVVEEEE